jgi:hypothetical protein
MWMLTLPLNGTLTAPPSEGSAFLPGEPSTNGHRKWPRCVRSSFGLRPRRECWLNLVEKCGFGPRVVVIVGLAHFMSRQFAFRQLVSSARGRCVEDRIIGASALSAAREDVSKASKGSMLGVVTGGRDLHWDGHDPGRKCLPLSCPGRVAKFALTSFQLCASGRGNENKG